MTSTTIKPSRTAAAARDASRRPGPPVRSPGARDASQRPCARQRRRSARSVRAWRRTAIVDLFAGPGGWDVAAHALNLSPLGVELDPHACATRLAAGLRTLQADVSLLDPADFAGRWGLWGLIASPPCQAFSMAGKGAGRRAIAAYVDAINTMTRGEPVDVEALDKVCGDERAHLVLEPLRWALATRPTWIALEQVPPVLPVWEAIARALRSVGYSCWTGLLTSEQFGVPQTRCRAILTAHRSRPMTGPPPSHQRYVPPRKTSDADALFDAPDPGRIVRPEDRDLLPWLSMAQALGWGMTERPSVTVAATNGSGRPRPLDGGSHGRAIVADARSRGGRGWQDSDLVGFPRLASTRSKRVNGPAETVTIDGVDYRERDLRAASEPAKVLTEQTRSWRRWIVDTGNTRSGTRPDGRARPTTAPAPAVTTRADQLEWRPERYDSRGQRDTRSGIAVPARQRSVDEPAPTIAGESRNDRWLIVGNQANATVRHADEPASTLLFGHRANRVQWVHDRPATTVQGDPRIWPLGHKVNGEDIAAGRDGYEGRAGENAIRVTAEEAATLQSFPPGYPWQGTRTQVFRQIGNAVPPLLALAVLQTTTGRTA